MQIMKSTILAKLLLIFTTSIAFSQADTPKLSNAAEVIAYVLGGNKVPNSDKVQIQKIKTTFSKKGRGWEITFRDADKKYTASINAAGKVKVKKKFDEDQNNAEFWSAFSDIHAIDTPEDYLKRAKDVIQKFNPKLTILDRAIVEYEVCASPKPGEKSDHDNGCLKDEAKETWKIFVQLKSNFKKREWTGFKVVSFEDGQPVSLANARVFGFRKW